MEFFRWILVLTGVGLLGVAYLMGRKKIAPSVRHRAAPDVYDPSVDELSVPIGDFNSDAGNASSTVVDWQSHANSSESSGYAVANNHHSDEAFLTDEEIDATLPGKESYGRNSGQVDLDINDQFDDADYDSKTQSKVGATSFANAVKQAAQGYDHSVADRNFSEEFETYAEEPVKLEDFEEKLVTVHVVAQRDKRFFGNNLKALFDQHGYRFGRMSLYHCTLEGDRVFSIANMVKPGTFDEQALDKFATPGITLFMRLPIELDADVAFDFLMREAQELAEELNGQLRDADRNPLSSQTIQHMREDIQQYVFRSKRVLQPS